MSLLNTSSSIKDKLIEKPDIENNIKPSEKFTCGMCYNEYEENDPLLDLKMLDKCKHAFCGECFKEYF